MSDAQNRLVRLSELAQHPSAGGVSTNTLRRWMIDGVRTAEGDTVRLQGQRLGYGWWSSVEALESFIEALNVGVAA